MRRGGRGNKRGHQTRAGDGHALSSLGASAQHPGPPVGLARQTAQPSAFGPILAIVVSTLFWGTLWIPLRRLNEAGPGGPWATAAGFTLPLLIMLPFALVRRRSIAAGGRPLVQAGFLMAACIALYSEALLRGSVARVILLFYLTPVWSTLLARIFLGDRITGARIVTIALGLIGMFVVFGIVGMELFQGMLHYRCVCSIRRV